MFPHLISLKSLMISYATVIIKGDNRFFFFFFFNSIKQCSYNQPLWGTDDHSSTNLNTVLKAFMHAFVHI